MKELNELCSAIGLIKSLDDCKAAVTHLTSGGHDMTFLRTESVSDYPKGCYLDIGENNVFWNSDPSGSSQESSRPICRG